MKKFLLIALFSICSLSSFAQPNIQRGTSNDDLIHQKYLEKLYSVYVDQLSVNETPYATIIGYPYDGFDKLKTSAFVPAKIDGTTVKSLLTLKNEIEHPASWFNRPSYGWYSPDQTLLPLKIKPGTYDILVWGGAYKPTTTLIRNVTISTGKQYIIYPRESSQNRTLSINEFSINDKHKYFEKEYYIIGEAVSQDVKFGNQE